jgi:hypothetical protein
MLILVSQEVPRCLEDANTTLGFGVDLPIIIVIHITGIYNTEKGLDSVTTMG